MSVLSLMVSIEEAYRQLLEFVGYTANWYSNEAYLFICNLDK